MTRPVLPTEPITCPSLDEVTCDRGAVGERRGLHVAHVLLLVDLHLPLVVGVRFLDVDRQELGAVGEPITDLLEAPDRAPEGRSCEAAEDEHQRPGARPLAQAPRGDAVELVDRSMIELSRDIEALAPSVERFVRGEPDALLLVEFAETEPAENHRRLDRTKR